MPSSWFPDKDLTAALEDFARKMSPIPGMPPSDGHGLVQEFGIEGVGLHVPARAIILITKPCELVEWSVDAIPEGSVWTTVEWSPWTIPRQWTDMVGPGIAPFITNSTNNSNLRLEDWAGPLYLRRKDAIRITITAVEGDVEQVTLVLYVREIQRLAIKYGSSTPRG